MSIPDSPSPSAERATDPRRAGVASAGKLPRPSLELGASISPALRAEGTSAATADAASRPHDVGGGAGVTAPVSIHLDRSASPCGTRVRRVARGACGPFPMTVGLLGAAIAVAAALAAEAFWVVPLAVAALALALAHGALTSPRDKDLVAVAGPPIEWTAVRRGVASDDARALLERIEQVEGHVTRLATQSSGESQARLVVALAQLRVGARSGISLATSLDRLAVVLGAAHLDDAETEAVALCGRADSEPDPTASETLRAAARRRALYASRVRSLVAVRDRLRADGEDLVAHLAHVGLCAECASVQPLLAEGFGDAALSREILAEFVTSEFDGD